MSLIRSRWASIVGPVKLRALASTRSGNQPTTNSDHSARDSGGPPGVSPAASAGATYLRTVARSTPTLAATCDFERPAYQCSKISTTSITSNPLLAITPRSSRGRARHLLRQGTGLVDPPTLITGTQPVDYVNARWWIT